MNILWDTQPSYFELQAVQTDDDGDIQDSDDGSDDDSDGDSDGSGDSDGDYYIYYTGDDSGDENEAFNNVENLGGDDSGNENEALNNVENLNAENVTTELFDVATEPVHDRLNEFGGGDNGAVGPTVLAGSRIVLRARPCLRFVPCRAVNGLFTKKQHEFQVCYDFQTWIRLSWSGQPAKTMG